MALGVRLWRGWVSWGWPRAPDFDAWIAPVARRAAAVPMDAWRFCGAPHARGRLPLERLCRELPSEGYHVLAIHPALDAEIVADDYRVTLEGRVAIHHAPLRPERAADAVYDGLWAWAWPNLGINVYRDGMMMERIWPLGENRTRLDYLYVFADPDADHAATFAMSDVVTAEDKAICEAVERNMAAGDIAMGPRHEARTGLFRDLPAAALPDPRAAPAHAPTPPLRTAPEAAIRTGFGSRPHTGIGR